VRFDDLDARCFLCGARHGAFDTSNRLCECVRPQGFPAGELSCYATILPEPRRYSVDLLPSLWAADPLDVFAVSAHGPGPDGPRAATAMEDGVYPFLRDLLSREHHLTCGNAMIHRSSTLEDVTGFGQVHVINMSVYRWTGTLKDPRSWAIINTALLKGITDLAVWTAGNAGLSLARLAHAANHRLPPEKRLQVHAIVDNDLSPAIRTQLKLWQCEVLDIFRKDKPILNPSEIKGLVAARLRRSRRPFDEARYWDVTDGWDGVGLLMYRYIAAQIIRDMAAASKGSAEAGPLYAVMPVGTGDLMLGFYLGMQDCERAGLIAPGDCRMIGALPVGSSILHNVRRRAIPENHAPLPAAPVMPKLTSTYTPLAPCFSALDRAKSVHFLTVTHQDQMRAGKHVLAGGIDDGLACEPSALAAFAALPHVYERERELAMDDQHWRYQSHARVLVVNSGLGVMSAEEEEFLRRATGS
jgi:pyridoxal-phosphate dependent enzyme